MTRAKLKQKLEEFTGMTLGIIIGMLLMAWVGGLLASCARAPEPEGMSDYRRCAAQCPEVFFLDFSTDPPTCDCTGIQC